MVNEGQNLLKVEVLLLALHAQVVESQVNHIDPGQGCTQVGPGEAAAWAARLAAPWLQAAGQGQGWDLGAGGRVAPGETREGRSGGARRGSGPSPTLSPSQGQPLDVLWALVAHGTEEQVEPVGGEKGAGVGGALHPRPHLLSTVSTVLIPPKEGTKMGQNRDQELFPHPFQPLPQTLPQAALPWTVAELRRS